MLPLYPCKLPWVKIRPQQQQIQWQQREALSPCCRLGIMPDLPIMQAHFCVLSNPEAHLNTVFSKTMWCNPYAPTIWNMNKWESILHMDGYYVVKITVVKYLGHEGIITNVSKEDKAYLVSIADILQCICPNFTRMSFLAMRKRCQWVSCKYLHYVFIYVFASICTSVFLSCQEGF